MAIQAEYRDQVIKFEHPVEHMYLDSVGKVTVGVGHMMPGSDQAVEQNFVHRDTGLSATDAEIKAEFDLIKSKAPKYIIGGKNAWYTEHTTLLLKKDDVSALLDKDIQTATTEAIRRYKNFNTLPDEIQTTLIEMTFNLGNNLHKFKSFNESIAQKKWDKAADQVCRPQLDLKRNQYVIKLLADTAKKAQEGTPVPEVYGPVRPLFDKASSNCKTKIDALYAKTHPAKKHKAKTPHSKAATSPHIHPTSSGSHTGHHRHR